LEDEATNNIERFNEIMFAELSNNKELLKSGNSNSSDESVGSDSAPSEDNLNASELIKNLPAADKTLKRKLKIEV
jgi:hypothetical protein